MPRSPRPPCGSGEATIRTAHAADAASLGTFLVPTWLDAHRGQVPDAVWRRRRAEWTPEVSAAAWRRTLGEIDDTAGHPSRVTLAETTDGDVVGLAMVTAVGDGTAEVDALYIGASWHGTGLGRSLLADLAAVAAADGASSIGVQVLAANQPARQFYEHLGGQPAGESVVDDDGVALPAVRYRWPVAALAEAAR